MSKKNIRNILFGVIMCGTCVPIMKEDVYAVNLKNNQVKVSKDDVLRKEASFKGSSSKKSLQYLGDRNNIGNGYTYIKGVKPIIISVPHSVKQPVRGNYNDGYGYKSAELYTGAIAKIIAEKTGAHVIYKSSYNGQDDNYSTGETPYRKKIKEIVNSNNIKLMIDVHGFNDSNKNQVIELGTAYGKNLLNKKDTLDLVLEALKENNFTTNTNTKINKVVIDKTFTGGGNKTLSSYVSSKLKVPSIQMEIGKTYRNVNNMDAFNRIINSLVDIIDNVSASDTVNNNVNAKLTARVINVKKHLNIRAKAGINNKVITTAPLGKKVSILDNLDKLWFKVQYGNKVGYASSKYLKLDCKTGKVSGVSKYINLREKAKESSKKIQRVNLGEKMEVLDATNKYWYKVRYKNKNGKYTIGYASKKYVKII